MSKSNHCPEEEAKMHQEKINWNWQLFADLNVEKLYGILQLREAVFQLEQQSLYQDLDDFDQISWHGVGLIKNKLCAYTRVRPLQDEVMIERVITPKNCRGQGIGKQLLNETMRFITEKYPDQSIGMSAQLGLQKYYEQFSFQAVGNAYEDGGIMHIKMRKLFNDVSTFFRTNF